jgi:uncharacterized membrane protein
VNATLARAAPRRHSLALRLGLAAFYVTAGTAHLLWTDTFAAIVPEAVPHPAAVVIFTGLCEIAGALALLHQRFRRTAGIMLAVYAVCVFPANVRHALLAMDGAAWPATWWYHGPRLALQPVLVWWALRAAA